MKLLHTICLFVLTACLYAHATVEEVLQDLQSPKVDPIVRQTPSYLRGYAAGKKIGTSMSAQEAVIYLKPIVYFQGSRKNQKGCDLDATLNNVLESVQTGLMNTAVTGEIRGKAAESIRGAPSSIATYAKKTVKEYASSAGSAAGNLRNKLMQWWYGSPQTTKKEE